MKNNNNRVDGQYAENLIERAKADAEKKWKEFEKFKNEKDQEFEKDLARDHAELDASAEKVKEKIEKIEEDIKKDIH